MNEKSTETIELLQRVLSTVIEKSGLQPCFMGNDIPAQIAVAADGGLPLFYEHARKMDRILADEGSTWLPGLTLLPADTSLSGGLLVCLSDNSSTARFPIVSLFIESLKAAISLTDDPGKIELAHLATSLKTEVLDELSINGWKEIHSSGESIAPIA